MEYRELVDCPKHGRFLYESTECPGCRNERTMQTENDAKIRDQRRLKVEMELRTRAADIVEQRMRTQWDPIAAKRDLLAKAVRSNENDRPLPPSGLMARFFARKRYREMAAEHEKTRKILDESVEKADAELASYKARWSSETISKEIELEFQKSCQHETVFKQLTEEYEVSKQRVQDRRSRCNAEFKRLRPNFLGSVEFVQRGSTVIGTLVAASQIDGILHGFVDCGKRVYSIRLPSPFLVERIGYPIDFYRARKGERQTISIRDYESDDEV